MWIIAPALVLAVWRKKLEQDKIQSSFYSTRVLLFIRPSGSIQHYTFCLHIAPGKQTSEQHYVTPFSGKGVIRRRKKGYRRSVIRAGLRFRRYSLKIVWREVDGLCIGEGGSQRDLKVLLKVSQNVMAAYSCNMERKLFILCWVQSSLFFFFFFSAHTTQELFNF